MQKISVTYVGRPTTKDGKNVSIVLNIRVTDFPAKRIASGIILPEKNFTRGTVVGTGKAIIEARKRLDIFKEKIESAFYNFLDQNKIPDPEILIQYISNQSEEALTVLKLADIIVEQKQSELQAGNCTPHLVEKFSTLKSQLQDFITTDLRKNDVFIGEVNLDFVSRFRMYLQGSLNNKNVTLNKKMSNLGQLFKYAVKNDWMKRDPTTGLKRMEEAATNHEFLTQEQVKSVFNFELPNQSHEVIKDSFLFMCFTGMAFSDMAKFKFADLTLSNGNQVLTYKRKKTKAVIQLVVSEILAELISKHYNRKKLNTNSKRFETKTERDPIFEVPSMQVYNRKIKTLFEFNELYTSFEISSHCARKTFGNLVNKLMGMSSASQLLGHSSIAITEKNYVNNADKELNISRAIELNSHLLGIF